ncbi:MAG: IS66 family transposase [Actinobacteria bacterium]|nr:IS66 family transposase [Actinomycetota bacterium]
MERRASCRAGSGRRRSGRLRVARTDAAAGGLAAENARLLAEIVVLRGQLEAARRAGKRQAAPFSKGDPKKDPQRPGRKSGDRYGTKAHRGIPDRVDEEIRVALPDACACCAGQLEFEDEVDQYQQDLVWVPAHVRRFRVSRGRCKRCGRRAQGRHPGQTSDAIGAAGSQIGPNVVATAAWLNKELGLPMSKVSQVLARLGVHVTAGGLYHAISRLAAAATPTCQALEVAVRASAAVAADETGWRVGGRRQWLWVFVGDDVTVYLIAPGRGYEQAASVLGKEFAGVLERDGWAPYRRFEHARHQTCVAHLLRRASELIADSIAGQAKIPHAVRRLLLDALAIRDTHQDLLASRRSDVIEGTCVEITSQPVLSADRHRDERDEIIAAGPDPEGRQAHLDTEIARLDQEIDALLARNPTHAPNRKLLGHLTNEREHLLTFLRTPAVAATNWRAEQAIRPAVVNRKNWGGNRTPHGAQVQQTLMSVIRTSRQQDVCPIALLADLLRQPRPAPSPMLRLPAATADPRGP